MHWNLAGCPACGGDLYLDTEEDSFTCLMCARSWPREGAAVVPLFLSKEKSGPRNAPRMRLRPVDSSRLGKTA
jgi:hypothetical protein